MEGAAGLHPSEALLKLGGYEISLYSLQTLLVRIKVPSLIVT